MNLPTYHDVMRHETIDRRGFSPDFGDSVEDYLQQQHDWALLLSARNAAIRRAFALAAAGIESASLSPDRRRDHYTPAMLHTARALAGMDYDPHTAGYLNFETALAALATLADRDE